MSQVIENLKEKFKDAKAEIKARWAILTDDDMAHLESAKDKIVAKIEKHYQLSKESAEKHLDEIVARYHKK